VTGPRRVGGVVLLLCGAVLLFALIVAVFTVHFRPESYAADPVGFAVTVVAAFVGWLVAGVCATWLGCWLLLVPPSRDRI